MDESDFNAHAERKLAALEAAIEDCGAEVDFEQKPGGILELEFEDGSKIIINRHTAAREIWVAARSGGFHFRPEGEGWVDTRSGEELLAALERLMGQQAGAPVSLRG